MHLKDLEHSKCRVWIIALRLNFLRFGWKNRRTLYIAFLFLRNDIVYPFSLQFTYKTSWWDNRELTHHYYQYLPVPCCEIITSRNCRKLNPGPTVIQWKSHIVIETKLQNLLLYLHKTTPISKVNYKSRIKMHWPLYYLFVNWFFQYWN